ncbi:MAG: glycerate kinase [Paracoccaceae bacterium]|nr:glycerate kinase [Paracoccaceae bacterium]
MQDSRIKEVLKSLYFSFLLAASPEKCLAQINPIRNSGQILIVGIGKAAFPYCELLQRKVKSNYNGIIISTYKEHMPTNLDKFRIFYASHPIPDEKGLFAAEYLMKEVAKLTSNDLLLFLISGGGSALLPAPPYGFKLEDEIILNKSLLRCGAPIQVMNLIRKHFSRIKGGRLARLAYPAKVLTLAVSDIPDDDINQVASGPTLATSGTIQEAVSAISQYKIDIPENILSYFNLGKVDTPKPEEACFRSNSQELLASASKCMKSVVNTARFKFTRVIVISDKSEGEAKNVAVEHARIIKDHLSNYSLASGEQVLFLSGGETSVTIVNPQGKGGRNCEYLLSLAIELESHNLGPYAAIAADTDGIDGTEQNAGAIIDHNTLSKIRAKNGSPKDLLAKNNSFLAFKAAHDLFYTGPTGTNINDFRAVIFNINNV